MATRTYAPDEQKSHLEVLCICACLNAGKEVDVPVLIAVGCIELNRSIDSPDINSHEHQKFLSAGQSQYRTAGRVS